MVILVGLRAGEVRRAAPPFAATRFAHYLTGDVGGCVYAMLRTQRQQKRSNRPELCENSHKL